MILFNIFVLAMMFYVMNADSVWLQPKGEKTPEINTSKLPYKVNIVTENGALVSFLPDGKVLAKLTKETNTFRIKVTDEISKERNIIAFMLNDPKTQVLFTSKTSNLSFAYTNNIMIKMINISAGVPLTEKDFKEYPNVLEEYSYAFGYYYSQMRNEVNNYLQNGQNGIMNYISKKDSYLPTLDLIPYDSNSAPAPVSTASSTETAGGSQGLSNGFISYLISDKKYKVENK